LIDSPANRERLVNENRQSFPKSLHIGRDRATMPIESVPVTIVLEP
jgi:hypothetical protein